MDIPAMLTEPKFKYMEKDIQTWLEVIVAIVTNNQKKLRQEIVHLLDE